MRRGEEVEGTRALDHVNQQTIEFNPFNYNKSNVFYSPSSSIVVVLVIVRKSIAIITATAIAIAITTQNLTREFARLQLPIIQQIRVM